MKILVLSDSHGNRNALRQILAKENDADMIVHLGDGAGDMAAFLPFTVNKSVICVRGNCDDKSLGFLEKQTFSAGDIRVLACHGHRFGVKTGLLSLYYEAQCQNAKLALYGHTHAHAVTENEGVLMVNPGAAFFGRYAVVAVEGGAISPELRYV